MHYVIVFLSFFLYNAVPLAGAWRLASRLKPDGRAGFLAFFLFVWTLEGLASFGLGAAFSLLEPLPYLFLSIGIGTGVCLLSGLRKKRLPPAEEYNFAERSFLGLGAVFFLLIAFEGVIVHSGTDAFSYHLYFPAMWIRAGHLAPVAIHGLPCEYLPPFGEMLYGWLMMPAGNSSFAGLLQPLALFAADCALLMLARACSCGRLESLMLFLLLPATAILSKNAMLCYSDLLTGAFLLGGTVLLITGALRGGDKRIGILAGLVMGCAAGMKYSGLLAAPLVTGVFCLVFLFRKKWRAYGLSIIPPAVFAGGCAYLGNFLRTGNPFYPVRFGALFPQGIDFQRPAVISTWPDLWDFFVTGDRMGFNLPTVLLFGLLPAAFFVCILWKRKRQRLRLHERLLIIPVSCGVILFVVHLLFYPAMAQPRQFIPAVMLLTPGSIPLLRAWKMRMPWKIVLGLVVPAALFSLPFNVKCLLLPAFFLPFLAGALFFRRRFPRFIAGAFLLFLLLLPLLFRFRIDLKDHTYALAADPVRCRAVKIVQDEYFTEGRHCRIAAMAIWNNYMFMEDMPGNLVFSISPAQTATVHPHETKDVRELRDPPAPYEVWLKRLRDAGITHLAIDLNAHHNYLDNKRIELDHARTHPETFEPLVNDESFYFFRVRPENSPDGR